MSVERVLGIFAAWRSSGPAGLLLALSLFVATMATVGGGTALASGLGFGIVPGSVKTAAIEHDGTIDSQAGSHPYDYTVSFELVQNAKHEPEGTLRDVRVQLPSGLIGDPLAVPSCPREEFDGITPRCPGATQIGIAQVDIEGVGTTVSPVFNLVPPPGLLARFGFGVIGLDVFQDASLRTGAGYGLELTAANIPIHGAVSVTETIWGVPADAGHDAERQCYDRETETIVGGCSTEAVPRPLLTLPTSCTGPLTTTLSADSAEDPGVYVQEQGLSLDGGGNPFSLIGCERIPFRPSIVVRPDTRAASAPTGLHLDLHLPGSEAPATLAAADLRDVQVALPEGMTINASAANGLAACPMLTGTEPSKEAAEAHGELTGIDLESAQPANCPDASRIGEVRLQTPLISQPLAGSVYLAAQGANPFGSLLAVYLAVADPASRVIVKLAGELHLDGETGRVTIAFNALPQLPFEDLKVTLWGGARAMLLTPAACATATASSQLVAWSATAAGPAGAGFSSAFTIDQGCAATGFSPSFMAGTLNNQAGAFSPFALTLSRGDSEQQLGSLEAALPPGVLAKLAGVPLCGEAEASAGACPTVTQIGAVQVAAGVGPSPVWIGGTIYLIGPHDGAPYGVSIEIPAIVGPFDLGEEGRPVVVRGSIRIDPETAQVTLRAGPFPTIRRGIPLHLKTVNVMLTRPSFTFNPTNCSPLSVSGTLTSIQGASVAVSSHFEAANCASLPFSPKLMALTYGNGEFTGHGASLHLKITTAQGQANMRSLKLDLPQRLPARLETIQQACPQRVFKLNPAACPRASVIGFATVATPLLDEAMRGPAILVSHGGAAFPDMVLVLQAQGVRIDLTGALFVDEKNITSTTFRTIPDVPIRRLDLVLPEGKSSVLAASASLCAKKPMNISTAITGQNGARVKPTVKVAVAGCKRPKALTQAQKLAKAMKACRKKAKGRRASCERQARGKYGTPKKARGTRAKKALHRFA
jgi:hypothetical protein